MNKFETMTPVIFRKWKNGDVIALFPTLPSDYRGVFVSSYEHIGQHSGADYYMVLSQTKLASYSDYADLLTELQAIGYNDLKIYQRKTQAMDIERQEYLTRIDLHYHKAVLAGHGKDFDASYMWMKILSRKDTELGNHAKKIVAIIDRRLAMSDGEN